MLSICGGITEYYIYIKKISGSGYDNINFKFLGRWFWH